MFKIVIVDGQGGGIGKSLVAEIKSLLNAQTDKNKDVEVIGLGTNSIATASMQKAGADKCATGENAIIFNVKNADVIVGPIGIVVANSLMGEITPQISAAIASSEATRILVPLNKCSTIVAGVAGVSLSQIFKEVAVRISEMVENL